jgi:hypothetical protein
MPTLRVEKVIERHTEYEIEVMVSYEKDEHRVGVIVSKPITRPKVVAAIQEVLNNAPSTGSPLLSCYWEGFVVEL